MITWTTDTRKLSELTPRADNPRYSTPADKASLNESLEDFGQPSPVLIGPNNELYDGHQRLDAWLEQHGDIEVDVRVANRPLTKTEHNKLIMALHSKATGRWDWDELDSWDWSELDNWQIDDSMLEQLDKDAARLGELLGDEHSYTAPEFKEYDESIADGVSACVCSECGHKHAKKD